MHSLHRYLERDGARLRDSLFSLSEGIMQNPLVQGLTVELNPFWALACQLEDAGIRPEPFLHPYAIGGHPFRYTLPVAPYPSGPFDFKRQPAGFRDASALVFGDRNPEFEPFLARIITTARQGADRDSARSLFTDLGTVARKREFPVLVEARPPCELIAEPGGKFLVGSVSGTVGGFLLDRKSGERFGATCGHVIDVGEDVSGDPLLGQCRFSRGPVPLPAGERCYAGCRQMTELDFALIGVPGASMRNSVTGVATVVDQGDLVDMKGGTSGPRQFEVGAACVDFRIGGSCWSRLYELRPVLHAGILAAGVRILFSPPPDGGDSGSWVTNATHEWCGVVVAADSIFGYALPAETTVANANRQFGTDLVLE